MRLTLRLIDFLPSNRNIIVASPCSGHGFKFASVVGEILADLAADGETALPIDAFSFAALTRRAKALKETACQMTSPTDWLTVHRGTAPLIVSLPHTGTIIPAELEPAFASRALALRDTDWWIDQLYDFAAGLGATVIRTAISRSVIDVNRDSSGASPYPGQNTTGLCPTTSFDGRPLYRQGQEPDSEEIDRRCWLGRSLAPVEPLQHDLADCLTAFQHRVGRA